MAWSYTPNRYAPTCLFTQDIDKATDQKAKATNPRLELVSVSWVFAILPGCHCDASLRRRRRVRDVGRIWLRSSSGTRPRARPRSGTAGTRGAAGSSMPEPRTPPLAGVPRWTRAAAGASVRVTGSMAPCTSDTLSEQALVARGGTGYSAAPLELFQCSAR